MDGVTDWVYGNAWRLQKMWGIQGSITSELPGFYQESKDTALRAQSYSDAIVILI